MMLRVIYVSISYYQVEYVSMYLKHCIKCNWGISSFARWCNMKAECKTEWLGWKPNCSAKIFSDSIQSTNHSYRFADSTGQTFKFLNLVAAFSHFFVHWNYYCHPSPPSLGICMTQSMKKGKEKPDLDVTTPGFSWLSNVVLYITTLLCSIT